MEGEASGGASSEESGSDWRRSERRPGGEGGSELTDLRAGTRVSSLFPPSSRAFFAFRSTSHLAVPPPNNTSYLGHLALPMPPDFVPACPLEPARRSTLLQATPCLEVSPRQRRACLCCPLRNDRRPTTMSLSSLSPEASSLKEALERFVSERCVPAEPECEAHVAKFSGPDRWTLPAVPPALEVSVFTLCGVGRQRTTKLVVRPLFHVEQMPTALRAPPNPRSEQWTTCPPQRDRSVPPRDGRAPTAALSHFPNFTTDSRGGRANLIRRPA